MGETLGVSAAVDVRWRVMVRAIVVVSRVVGGRVRAVAGSDGAKMTKTVGIPNIS